MDRNEGSIQTINETFKNSKTILRFSRLLFSLLILAASLVWVVLSNLPTDQKSDGITPIKVGAPAPDFQLKTLEGQQISLSDFKGQPLILNFFASWCDPCREEAPLIKELSSQAKTKDFAIVGIGFQDEPGLLSEFAKDEGLNMPVALDMDGKVSRAYWVVGPPATFFIDENGVLQYTVAGPLTEQRVEDGLHAAFNGGATSADQNLSQASTTMGLILALGAGLLSFFSPCTLPLLPAFLGYMTGLSTEELKHSNKGMKQRSQILAGTIAFTIGLTLAFTILGASASLFGGWLATYKALIAQLGGILVLLFGFHMIGFIHIPFLSREYRPGLHAMPKSNRRKALSAMVMGMAFGIGWSPCIGPMLGSILLLASQEDTVRQGMLLLAVYGLGLGIPFILTGLAANRLLAKVKLLSRYLPYIEKFGGAILVSMGILLIFNKLETIVQWFSRIF